MHDHNSRLERRITAYHEAAHAVMAFKCGIPVDVVTLWSRGPMLGSVRVRRASLLSQVFQDTSGTVIPWPIVAEDAEKYALLYLAGPLGEAKLLGARLRAHCCESDLKKCEQLCENLRLYRDYLVEVHEMALPEIDAAQTANRLLKRAARILNRRAIWRSVVALAADLEAWRWLSGDDAADTVQWTRRLRDQLALHLPVPSRSDGGTATSRNGAQLAALG